MDDGNPLEEEDHHHHHHHPSAPDDAPPCPSPRLQPDDALAEVEEEAEAFAAADSKTLASAATQDPVAGERPHRALTPTASADAKNGRAAEETLEGFRVLKEEPGTAVEEEEEEEEGEETAEDVVRVAPEEEPAATAPGSESVTENPTEGKETGGDAREEEEEEEQAVGRGGERLSASSFSPGDLVWAKVKSHPWWAGQVFDPADASRAAEKVWRSGRQLVAFFGDRTFGWLRPSQMLGFRAHYGHKRKQTTMKSFCRAIGEALDEVCRQSESSLRCPCLRGEPLHTVCAFPSSNAGIRINASFAPPTQRGEIPEEAINPEAIYGYIRSLACSPLSPNFDLDAAALRGHSYAFRTYLVAQHLLEAKSAEDEDASLSVLLKNSLKGDTARKASSNLSRAKKKGAVDGVSPRAGFDMGELLVPASKGKRQEASPKEDAATEGSKKMKKTLLLSVNSEEDDSETLFALAGRNPRLLKRKAKHSPHGASSDKQLVVEPLAVDSKASPPPLIPSTPPPPLLGSQEESDSEFVVLKRVRKAKLRKLKSAPAEEGLDPSKAISVSWRNQVESLESCSKSVDDAAATQRKEAASLPDHSASSKDFGGEASADSGMPAAAKDDGKEVLNQRGSLVSRHRDAEANESAELLPSKRTGIIPPMSKCLERRPGKEEEEDEDEDDEEEELPLVVDGNKTVGGGSRAKENRASSNIIGSSKPEQFVSVLAPFCQDLLLLARNPTNIEVIAAFAVSRDVFLRFRNTVFQKSPGYSDAPIRNADAAASSSPEQDKDAGTNINCGVESEKPRSSSESNAGMRKRKSELESAVQARKALKKKLLLSSLKSSLSPTKPSSGARLGNGRRVERGQVEKYVSKRPKVVATLAAPPVEKASSCFTEDQLSPQTPVALFMKFPRGFALPSEVQLKAIFVRFGGLQTSGTRVYHSTCAAQVVFRRGCDAESALAYTRVNSLFGKAQVTYKLKHFLRPLIDVTQSDLASGKESPSACTVKTSPKSPIDKRNYVKYLSIRMSSNTKSPKQSTSEIIPELTKAPDLGIDRTLCFSSPLLEPVPSPSLSKEPSLWAGSQDRGNLSSPNITTPPKMELSRNEPSGDISDQMMKLLKQVSCIVGCSNLASQSL